MLASQYRLKRAEYDKIKKQGKVFQSEDFGFVYFKREDNGPSRFGIVISTKISKQAVNRNRMKRALLETVRRNVLSVPKGSSCVFLVKKSMSSKTTDEIMKQAEHFLKKTNFPK
jgi:ribonuclease P protein component